MSATAILILAAGESKRMGQAKQLLPLGDTTILGHSLSVCQKSKIGPIWIVLGARANEIRKSLPAGAYQIVINEAWKDGMGSSMAAGIRVIQQDSQITEVVIVLADQVKLTERSLQNFHALYKGSEKTIAVSMTEEGAGPPSIFDRQWFHALASLSGDQGAKPVVKSNRFEVLQIVHAAAEQDVDTPEDYRRLSEG